MTESDDIQRRWRDLAEQLGLPPEAGTPAESPPSNVEAVVERTVRNVGTLDQGRPSVVVEPPARELELERAEPETPESAEAPIEAEDIPGEERRAPRGRRRGRRGPRKAEPSAAETAEGEPVAEEKRTADAEEEVPPERSRGRARGRSRPRKEAEEETEPVVADESEDDPEEEPTPEPAVDEGEDDDDMSGWTIPSWQELISSLYRPDR